MALVVRNWRVEKRDDGARVSADIGDMNVWISLPAGVPVAETGDAFLAIALLPAMAAGAELDLRAIPAVSSALASRLPAIQDIWATWNPLLRRVTVRANEYANGTALMPGGAAFFSGGVDALFTAITRRADVEHLILINGFDFMMTADAFSAACARAGRQADYLGLPLVPIETNWIDFTRHHRIARLTSYGSALAAFALALAPERMLIAASNSYARLLPSGSHPLLDPLWSTGVSAIEHDGCQARREEKLLAIAEHSGLLSDLWVCHKNAVKNCGSCPKCLRLRVSLWLMGKEQLPFSTTLADPLAAWCRVARSRSERAYLDDMVWAARKFGRPEAARRLVRWSQRSDILRLLRDADQLFLQGRIARRRQSSDKPDLLPWGIGLFPEP